MVADAQIESICMRFPSMMIIMFIVCSSHRFSWALCVCLCVCVSLSVFECVCVLNHFSAWKTWSNFCARKISIKPKINSLSHATLKKLRIQFDLESRNRRCCYVCVCVLHNGVACYYYRIATMSVRLCVHFHATHTCEEKIPRHTNMTHWPFWHVCVCVWFRQRHRRPPRTSDTS